MTKNKNSNKNENNNNNNNNVKIYETPSPLLERVRYIRITIETSYYAVSAAMYVMNSI